MSTARLLWKWKPSFKRCCRTACNIYRKPRRMKAVVTERGQVTIPKDLRKRLGIHPKTVLNFQEENGCLVVRKVETSDPVAEVCGCLKFKRSTDAILTDLRGKV